MNKNDIIALIAENAGCTKAAAGKAANALFAAVVKEVASGKEVSVSGFGSFKLAKKAPRTARNPRTGAAVKVAAHKAPAFKASKAFKEACNK